MSEEVFRGSALSEQTNNQSVSTEQAKKSKGCRSHLSSFFGYKTPRIVDIRSKKLGSLNRFIQLSIVVYIIGYVFVYMKGYQETEKARGVVTIKVKGIALSHTHLPPGVRLWDPSDYVHPPKENNAFFVKTKVKATLNQKQTTCAEDPKVKGAKCDTSNDCNKAKGTILPKGNGVLTGECTHDNTTGRNTCEIFGWCPIESNRKTTRTTVLDGVRRSTVFIKNNVEFPKFGVKRKNVFGFKNNTELSSCRWSRKNAKDELCPIFVLEDIIKDAGFSFKSIASEGGVILIVINWTCNLDFSEDDCSPSYTFRRLDTYNSIVSAGFNFRYADKYAVFNVKTQKLEMHRDAYKAYGVYFMVSVQGTAAKFSILPLLLNIGNGCAFLGCSAIMCDFLAMYVLKSRNFYRDKKYERVKGLDAFQSTANLRSIQHGKGSGSSKASKMTALGAAPSLDFLADFF